MLSGQTEQVVAWLDRVKLMNLGTLGCRSRSFPGVDQKALAVPYKVGIRQAVELLQVCNRCSILFSDLAQRFTRLDDMHFRGGGAAGS